MEMGSIYKQSGVETFINAYGTLITLGGTLMPAEVVKAMEEALHNVVKIHDLQDKVGKRLAELIGVEATVVTAGASDTLCIATYVVTLGDDRPKMTQLPDLTGMKSEIVIQKGHRSGFDHAFRMVGVKLINLETADEAQRAINPNTAAVAHVFSHNNLEYKVDLEMMIGIAHAANVPLILDAAAEVPPVENLSKFVKQGADLEAFSGGKNLRGPQCAGLLLGRSDSGQEGIRQPFAEHLLAAHCQGGKGRNRRNAGSRGTGSSQRLGRRAQGIPRQARQCRCTSKRGSHCGHRVLYERRLQLPASPFNSVGRTKARDHASGDDDRA
jgi:seryl-tRNA(Sec) selenium transferase